MSTVHETLQGLREQYVEEGTENLDQIARLIGRLEEEPNRVALEGLHRRFLGLAGSGYTYGFPLVSTLGRRGEWLSASLLRDEEASRTESLGECRTVLGLLREEFARLHAVYATRPWMPARSGAGSGRGWSWALPRLASSRPS
jgi:hypothetical protein